MGWPQQDEGSRRFANAGQNFEEDRERGRERLRRLRALLRAEAAKADQYIADQLKAMYDAVVVEPIPDRLLQLLDRLDNDAEK